MSVWDKCLREEGMKREETSVNGKKNVKVDGAD